MESQNKVPKLVAKDIHVCRKGQLILNNVSFVINANTLTGIIGPNGAGKSTLMRALSGEQPNSGDIFVDGQSLYANPQYWLQEIGYVPEDNILHDHLTLWDALMFVGRLRLSNNTELEIESRVDSLLTEFGFDKGDERRAKQLKVLSTGERKKANICSELIIDPSILMLDEPTSNLDPNAEYELMQLLSNYAHSREKTVLVITHTLNTIEFCDDILFIENAVLRAFGAPQLVLNSLEKAVRGKKDFEPEFKKWARVFDRFKTQTNRRQSCDDYRWTSSPEFKQSRQKTIKTTGWLSQTRILLSRYMKVRLGDLGSLIGTLLAGLSGIMFFILPNRTFVKPFDPSEVALGLTLSRQSIYVVALVVTLIGLITSYTEISKEYRIYRHERLKGLSPSAYFVSKWIWLVLGVGILAPLLVLFFIVIVYQQPFAGFPEARIGEVMSPMRQLVDIQLRGLVMSRTSWLVGIVLILSCITSVTLGLLLSVLAGEGGRGYVYLSFTVVFIVLFSGLIRNEKLESLVNIFSFASTGKWAYEGLASSMGIYCWLDSWHFDEFNSTGHIISIWLSLCVFTLISGLIAVIVLYLRDPWHSKSKNLRRFVKEGSVQLSVYLSILLLLLSYAIFLRLQSQNYHLLNYWSRQDYGGSGSYEYANIQQIETDDFIPLFNGQLSESWCTYER